MRIRSLLLLIAITGCAPKHGSEHDEHLARIAELEGENARLEREVGALRARYEAASLSPIPAIETRCAKKGAAWRITPAGLDEILKNEAGMRKEARPRPYFEGGKYVGMRIGAPASSFAASCGCEDGDVLQKVHVIDANPSKLPEIEAALKKASKIELEVLRAGAVKTVAIDIGN